MNDIPDILDVNAPRTASPSSMTTVLAVVAFALVVYVIAKK